MFKTALSLILLTFAVSLGGHFHSRPQPAPLWQLAEKHGLELGVYIARDRMHEKDYQTIANRDFNLFIADGQPNWQFNDSQLRPGPHDFDFHALDEVTNFTHDHAKPLRIQHLVWGEEKWLPDWLKNGNYPKAELLDLIHEHINTMAARYGPAAKEWTVVNEAFTRGRHEHQLNDWWADHTGDQDYIKQAFIWARQALPNATLILNDFGDEEINDVSNSMYDYVKNMKSEGVPIDAIGMQMHISGDRPPKKDDVIKNMKRFGELGLKVYVTEFDVNMNEATGSPREKQQKQAEIYHDLLRACLESGVCPSFSVLGLTDKESWYNEMGVPDAMPLPFDSDYHPKPAYFAIREALSTP